MESEIWRTEYQQIEKGSVDNLHFLAEELAMNYFKASVVDMELIPSTTEEKWDNLYSTLEEGTLRRKPKEVKPDIGLASREEYSRNIVVIGAGCSKNSFKSIKTAAEAREDIYRNIEIAQVPGSDETLDLNYLLNYYGKHIEKINGVIFKADKTELNNSVLNEFIKSQKDNSGVNLTAKKFFEEYYKLNLYNSEFANREGVDFEASLNLLAKIVSISKVRETIKDIYDRRHGPNLFYEILAHLFKHRFIDVIINFNFDELLDQALEDELEPDAYDIILSDGDCRPISDLSENGRLRQPLYVKPHGTASHKSTLRFTKDHYFELPVDMRNFLEELISCQRGSNLSTQRSKNVNLIIAGFQLGSIEFNEILKRYLPENSNLFYFYHFEETYSKNEIIDEYGKAFKNVLLPLHQNFKYPPAVYMIGHNFFQYRPFRSQFGKLGENVIYEAVPSYGKVFGQLYAEISSCFNDSFKPRKINRHLLVSALFGNHRFWEMNIENNTESLPKEYFNSHKYYMDRVLIEILIHLLFNKGKIDPPLLMNGRTGRYYSLYFDEITRLNKENDRSEVVKPTLGSKKGKPGIKSMAEIIHFFDGSNKYTSLEINSFDYFQKETFEEFYSFAYKKIVSDDADSGFFSEKMRDYLISLGEDSFDYKYIQNHFNEIRHAMRSTIQSQLRTREYHIFQNYQITDLITTDLTLDLHFYQKLLDKKVTKICIVADYGVQLRNFLNEIFTNPKIYPPPRIYVILVDYRQTLGSRDSDRLKSDTIDGYLNYKNTTFKALIEKSGSNITAKKLSKYVQVLYLPINTHNHHMTIFLDEKNESDRVIYYYQRGLSRGINPMRIVEQTNIEFLKKKFRDYSERAMKHCGIDLGRQPIDFNWIDIMESESPK